MLTKNANNESNTISGKELQLYTIPTIMTPNSIIINNKKGSFFNGSFKGLKKSFFMYK